MQLHNLKKNRNNRKARQVGRGGKRGKTSGRGTKGQNARSGRKKRPEMRDIIKKFPKLRGRGRNFLKSIQIKHLIIKTSVLESKFSSGEEVSIASLAAKGIVAGHPSRIKIVADKPMTKKIKVSGLSISSGARQMIEMAGGTVA